MLSDEQFAEIEDRAAESESTYEDVQALCDERDALWARLAEAESIIAAMANVDIARHEDDTEYCIFCKREMQKLPNGEWAIVHATECARSLARAYRARADATHAQPPVGEVE